MTPERSVPRGLRTDQCWVHHDHDCSRCPRYWLHSDFTTKREAEAALPAALGLDVERLARALHGCDIPPAEPYRRSEEQDLLGHTKDAAAIAAEYARLVAQEQPK
jgi:hypothetical protein